MTFLMVLFMAISVALLFFLIREIYRVLKLKRIGQQTTATIVGYELQFGQDGDEGEVAVLAYKFQNKTRKFTERVTINKANYPIGKEMPILFDPNNEKLVKVDSFWGLYRDVFLFLVLSLIFLSISLIPILIKLLSK